MRVKTLPFTFEGTKSSNVLNATCHEGRWLLPSRVFGVRTPVDAERTVGLANFRARRHRRLFVSQGERATQGHGIKGIEKASAIEHAKQARTSVPRLPSLARGSLEAGARRIAL